MSSFFVKKNKIKITKILLLQKGLIQMAKNTYYIDKDTGLCKIKNKDTKQESIIKEFQDFRQAKFYSLHIYGTEFERANYIGSYEDSRIYEYEDLQKKQINWWRVLMNHFHLTIDSISRISEEV